MDTPIKYYKDRETNCYVLKIELPKTLDGVLMDVGAKIISRLPEALLEVKEQIEADREVAAYFKKKGINIMQEVAKEIYN